MPPDMWTTVASTLRARHYATIAEALRARQYDARSVRGRREGSSASVSLFLTPMSGLGAVPPRLGWGIPTALATWGAVLYQGPWTDPAGG